LAGDICFANSSLAAAGVRGSLARQERKSKVHGCIAGTKNPMEKLDCFGGFGVRTSNTMPFHGFRPPGDEGVLLTKGTLQMAKALAHGEFLGGSDWKPQYCDRSILDVCGSWGLENFSSENQNFELFPNGYAQHRGQPYA
jgi:hypothetical protein